MAMAVSMTMPAASFLGGSTVNAYKHPSVVVARCRRCINIVAMAKQAADEKMMTELSSSSSRKEEGRSKRRRELVFAAAAAATAACSIAKNIAMADEPKRGTEEARKKYGPVCVTMPTARICHN
ncbi:hypothetical protein Dimus_021433 [Dionaea muscipula]